VDGLLLSWRIEKAFMVFLHPATLAKENRAGDADLNQQLQLPVLGPASLTPESTPAVPGGTCASWVVGVGNPED
jgi:hypothetical protein